MCKKILAVAYDFPPSLGGIQKVAYNAVLALQSAGYDVTVLTAWRPGSQTFDSTQAFRVYRLRLGTNPVLLLLRYAIAFLRFNWVHQQQHFDIVINFNIMHRAWFPLLLANSFSARYVSFVHGVELFYNRNGDKRYNRIRGQLRRSDLIIANSRFTAKKVFENQGNVVTIYPAVDDHFFKPSPKPGTLRDKYHLGSEFILLTTSRLVVRKGHQQVIRSLPKVLEEYPRLKYVIVGDGPERRKLERMVKDMNLQFCVFFLGALDDDYYRTLLNLSDVFIMPNVHIEELGDYEGFGIVFLEAGACGKPVIGGRNGGVTEAIVDGKSGYLVDSHDLDDVAAKIRLCLNPSIASQFGKYARERVEYGFTWKSYGQHLLNAMKRL